MQEPSVDQLMTVTEAIDTIDRVAISPPRIDRGVPLADSLGRRLAEDLVAETDSPHFDKSQMDGFAVRAADLQAEPVTLRVVGEVAAGDWPADMGLAVSPGTCARIFTGAAVPAGADAVVPVEFSQLAGSDEGVERVILKGPCAAGKFIARRGSDCSAGTCVLPRGALIGAGAIAVAATIGKSTLNLFARPRVSLLTTGDELVSMDDAPGRGRIRDANSPMLAALMRTLGCEVIHAGRVRDDPGAIRSAMLAAARVADVLIVSGGMSMGDRDFVPGLLAELGATVLVSKLKIKPGKPFLFCTMPSASCVRPAVPGADLTSGLRDAGNTDGACFIFGLPGNPVSGFVCALRLCTRLISRLAGGAAGDGERWANRTLAMPLSANGSREFYQPVAVDSQDRVLPLPWKGSADVFTLARAGGFVVRAENEPAIEAGAMVRVLEIPR